MREEIEARYERVRRLLGDLNFDDFLAFEFAIANKEKQSLL